MTGRPIQDVLLMGLIMVTVGGLALLMTRRQPALRQSLRRSLVRAAARR